MSKPLVQNLWETKRKTNPMGPKMDKIWKRKRGKKFSKPKWKMMIPTFEWDTFPHLIIIMIPIAWLSFILFSFFSLTNTGDSKNKNTQSFEIKTTSVHHNNNPYPNPELLHFSFKYRMNHVNFGRGASHNSSFDCLRRLGFPPHMPEDQNLTFAQKDHELH